MDTLYCLLIVVNVLNEHLRISDLYNYLKY